MKSTDLRSILEAAGVISVVASLIFVGLQLNQDQKIAIANQYQSRAETSIANYRSRLESETYISAVSNMSNEGIDSLTPEERVAYQQSILMDYINADNDYYQNESGFISKEYWDGRRSRIKSTMQNDFVREFYNTVASRSDVPFSQFIFEISNEIEAER